MPVEPIKQRRLYQEVAAQLSRLIAAGEFKPGQRLPSERDLAASLKVSRPTIREAMIALELAGAVEIRTGSGIFVIDDHADSEGQDAGPGPFELIEARICIEGEAAAIAAERISEAELNGLEAINEEMADLTARRQSVEEADMRFHLAIAEATQNSALAAAVEQLWEFRARMPMWRKLHEMIWEIEQRPDWSDDRNAVIDHRDIVKALRSRNPAMARDVMQGHLKRVREVLLKASELDAVDIEFAGAAPATED